jgi:conjugal transfer pilus assembly protein TraW
MASSLLAEDLGTFGQTFPIQEKNLLEVIQEKLKTLEKSGVLKDHQQKIVERVRQALKRPTAVEGIKATTQPRVFTFNPSIVVPYDLKDHQGQVFQQAGTVINPLHFHSLTKPLLFIDGDDADQVNWALKQQEHHQQANQSLPKIILVKGSPFDLMERHDASFYFDQSGILVKKLGIRQVPAHVSQSGEVLTIEEVKLHDD